MSDTVGIVGLGNAGSALATSLSGKVTLIGFDINPDRRNVVTHLSIQCVDSIAEISARAGTVILSLPKQGISREVIAELLRGQTVLPKLIIETSTLTPKVAQELYRMCKACNVSFVDAAIAGGVAGMAAGQTTFLVGGEESALAQARPVLEMMAKEVFCLGPVGAGMGAKVVINAIMHALMIVLIEASAMAVKLGIPMEMLANFLRREEGLMRPLTHRVQERIMRDSYDGGMSVSNASKDSMLALETAQDLGVPLFAIQASHTLYEIGQASGLGHLDYAVLATLWEKWTGVRFADDPSNSRT